MPDITILAEKIGTLTLEGGIEVKIVQVEGGGMRLFFDRPLAYCQDCVTFEGDEDEGEDDGKRSAYPRKHGPPPAVRMAIKKRERDKITGMGMFD